MDNIFSDVERVLSALTAPLGDYAPRRRHLVADYKDTAGRDLHQEFLTIQHPKGTDEALVDSIKAELTRIGCRLTALAECKADGMWQALYLSPGYLEEYAAETGLTMPKDIAAALSAAGIHPVNLEELKRGR